MKKILNGLEIIKMIANNKAPQKIKWDGDIWKYNKYRNDYTCEGETLNLVNLLKDKFEIEEELKAWKPKEGEEYYMITGKGNIIETKAYDSHVSGYGLDKEYALGNCFKTEEEAQKLVEKIKIYIQLKRYAETHNKGKIDFKNDYQTKYYLCYNHYHNRIETENFNRRTAIGKYYEFVGNIYFTSEEICKNAIQEIGKDNIKKLFED